MVLAAVVPAAVALRRCRPRRSGRSSTHRPSSRLLVAALDVVPDVAASYPRCMRQGPAPPRRVQRRATRVAG